MLEISRGSVASSRDEQRQHQLAGPHRRLGDQPPQGRRTAQPPRSDLREPHALAIGYFELARRRVVGRRSDGLVTGWPDSSSEARRAAPKSASASTSSSTDGFGGQHVDAQAVLLGGLGRGRADHRDDRRGVRLAGDADQVAHRRGRGEHDRVELARLDRLAGRGRRRRGAHGAVGRDVVDLPAEVDQAGHEGLGGDVGARQEDPVDRVEQVVVRRPVLEQPAGGLLAGGHQVGVQAPVGERGGGLVADGRDLQAGEGAGVEAVLLELLAHGAHGVDRGERDPLVAALDQPADGLVHLLGVARRLDGDRRHLLGHGAEAAQPRGQRAGLLLGARHQHAPAEQRLGLEPRQRLAQVDDRADDRDRRRRHPGGAGVGGDVGQRGDDRLLRGQRAGAGHRDRGVASRPAAISSAAMSPIERDRREQHQRRVGGVGLPVDPGVAAGHHGHLAVVLGGQRDAGVRRDGGHRGDARDDLEADPGLGAGLRLLGTGGVDERVARHQAYDALAGLGLA